MRRIPARLWALSALSAILEALPFPIAGPVPLWRRSFAWFCLVPLLLALRGPNRDAQPLTIKQSAIVAYLSGILWYLFNCYWIYPTMHSYGGLASPVAFLILILFALYLGLYHALFGAIFALFHRSFRWQRVLLLTPFLWVAVELARARITGFPWDLLGYTQVNSATLTRLAPFTGVMGLSFVVAAVNAIWLGKYEFRTRSARASVVAGVALLALTILFLSYNAPDHRIRPLATAVLLQDNLKIGAERTGSETHAELYTSFAQWTQHPLDAGTLQPATQPIHPDIILWPEAPADFFDADPVFRSTVGSIAASSHAPLIVDAIGISPPLSNSSRLREYNSASYFAADGSYIGRYNKMHLVPFGEYTPYKQIFFFAGHVLDQVGGFTPGAERTLFRTGGHSFGTFICYESIFGDEVRQLVLNGADVLVNVSDDGWYGDSSAPWEHLDMARMRAIENHRWVLRSTNTGVTTAIDPQGRTGPQLPRHIRASLLTGFNYETATTFYTRHGDWLAWLCAAITLAAGTRSFLIARHVT